MCVPKPPFQMSLSPELQRRFKLANKSYNAKKWKQAIAGYKQCIADGLPVENNNPKELSYTHVYFRMAAAYGACHGESETAIEYYTKYIDQSSASIPLVATAFYNRAELYRCRQQYDLAISDYTSAIACASPGDSQLLSTYHIARADVYRRTGLCDMELADLEGLLNSRYRIDSKQREFCHARVVELRTLFDQKTAAEATAKLSLSDRNAAAKLAISKRKRELESESTASAAAAGGDGGTNKRVKPNEKTNGSGGSGEGGDDSGGGSGSGGVGGAVTAVANSFQSAPAIHLSALTEIGVNDYLRSTFGSVYVKAFQDNKVNGATLCTFDDADLTELGVSNRFHRRRILADAARERESKLASSAGGGGGTDSKHSVAAGGSGSTPTGVLFAHELVSQLLFEQSKSHAAAAALEEAKKCVVCLDASKTVRFAPCNHICCCEKCGLAADALKACPLCRSVIATREKLFFN